MAKVLLFGQIAELIGTRELYLEAGDTQPHTARTPTTRQNGIRLSLKFPEK
jgi:hypothetical protein